jgi:hypothetical protein
VRATCSAGGSRRYSAAAAAAAAAARRNDKSSSLHHRRRRGGHRRPIVLRSTRVRPRPVTETTVYLYHTVSLPFRRFNALPFIGSGHVSIRVHRVTLCLLALTGPEIVRASRSALRVQRKTYVRALYAIREGAMISFSMPVAHVNKRRRIGSW